MKNEHNKPKPQTEEAKTIKKESGKMAAWSKEKTEYREALAKIHAKMKKVSRNSWKSLAWSKLMDEEYKLKVDTIKKVGYEEFESYII